MLDYSLLSIGNAGGLMMALYKKSMGDTLNIDYLNLKG